MKRFLYFKSVNDAIYNINKSLCIEDNHISFTSTTPNTFAQIAVYENFFSKISGTAQLKNYESGFIAKSDKTAHLYITDQISNNFLITSSLSNSNFVPSLNEIKQKEIYLRKSLFSLAMKYSRLDNSLACILQLGLQNNQSPVSAISFSYGKFNCSIKGVFTDRANLLYTSILTHGILASIKLDISLSQLQGIECGYLYTGPNDKDNSAYALYNLYKKSIEFGGYGFIGNKKLAASGRYDFKSNDFSTEIGGFIFDIGELRLKFNSKQQLEFLTKLSPKPWVDVSIKTTSTISSSVLKSVNFGWSLDFHKDF